MLNVEQNIIFDKVTKSVAERKDSIFFMDAPGGCGKTFTINIIMDYLRNEGIFYTRVIVLTNYKMLQL